MTRIITNKCKSLEKYRRLFLNENLIIHFHLCPLSLLVLIGDLKVFYT